MKNKLGLPKIVIASLFLAIIFNPANAAVFHPQSFTLANGLQVIVVPNRLSMAVAQMVWYKAGSVDEPKGKSGIAHYLEHMMFRGTASLPAGEFSSLIASQGGKDNAFTSYDHTAYYEIVSADRLSMIMQMEADRMQNLRITPENATPELNVVLNERQERTDNSPQGILREKVQSALFPKHPYGIPVIGWKNEVEKLSPNDVKTFYENYYTPNNAIVVISGNVDLPEVMRLSAATFGRVESRKVARNKIFTALTMPREKLVTMKDARVQQPSIGINIITDSYSTQKANEAYALEVLSEALSGGEVGVLYKQLVLKKRIASAIDTSYDPQSRDHSVFSFLSTPAPEHTVDELERELKKSLHVLAQKGLTSATVSAAKERMSRSAVFARDSLMAPCQIFGSALTTGQKASDIENWPEKINAVSTSEVNAALRKLVSSKYRVTGILLPEKGEGNVK